MPARPVQGDCGACTIRAHPTTTAPTTAVTAATATTGAVATNPPAQPTDTTAPPAPQVKPPIAYPDPTKIDVGGAPVKKQPINQIVGYKSYPDYHQPPWMDKLVTAGTIPAVKDRLPKEPQVYLTSGMSDGPGVYGDLWRGFSACPTAGYNYMAGVTMGWFGIESYTVHYRALVKVGPLFRADQDIEPFPEVAKSWEWSDDGKTLTMHLIEGAKWSDGVPFNADDVMFTWEGYILDPKVNAPRKIDAFTWNGTAAKLEKVDDYTIKWTLPVSKPFDIFYLLYEGVFDVMPMHILKPLHPAYSTANPKPSYTDFQNCLPPDHLPLVTLGPWVITEYKTDELMIFRRNPFFWKVDENANQLPYLDEIQYRKGPSGIGRDLCTEAGDCDHMNLENPSSYVDAMTKAQAADAKFQISWGEERWATACCSTCRPITARRTTATRRCALFRDLRFRQAVSYASDRDGIAQSIMRGPFLRGWAGGLYPGAPSSIRRRWCTIPSTSDSAKALLADMGLKDSNNDGVLEWQDGTQKGQSVVLQILASEDAHETQSVAEALVNQWGQVGIKLNMRTITSSAFADINQSGNWDMQVYRGGQERALPFVNVTALGPITKQFTPHREGDTPRVLLDFEQSLIDIINKYRSTFDSAGRNDLMKQYNNIITKNVYDMGVFCGRYGLGTAKRIKNLAGLPVFMYPWWKRLSSSIRSGRPLTSS